MQRLESELQQSREDSETSARASDDQRKDMKLWLQALQRSDEAKEREIAMLKVCWVLCREAHGYREMLVSSTEDGIRRA